jgi:hypothetical protein
MTTILTEAWALIGWVTMVVVLCVTAFTVVTCDTLCGAVTLASIRMALRTLIIALTCYKKTLSLHIQNISINHTINYKTWIWATGWTIRVLGFNSQQGLGIFLFTTASTMTLRPTQPPIQCIPGALSLEVKKPGHEADHSTPSSAKDKEYMEPYLHSPIHLHGMVLS